MLGIPKPVYGSRNSMGRTLEGGRGSKSLRSPDRITTPPVLDTKMRKIIVEKLNR